MTAADDLAAGVRAALAGRGALREVRMFGGLCFMLDGNMVAGVFRDDLLVRVGADAQAEALARPGARPMEMRGRVMRGYVVVDAAGLSKAALEGWVREAAAFVATLPAKAPKAPRPAGASERSKGRGR
jgi:TfoX/Sxy family transcriptional regulator of competence genes